MVWLCIGETEHLHTEGRKRRNCYGCDSIDFFWVLYIFEFGGRVVASNPSNNFIIVGGIGWSAWRFILCDYLCTYVHLKLSMFEPFVSGGHFCSQNKL